MTLIFRVTSTTPRLPLSQLLQRPLGHDLWEVKPSTSCCAQPSRKQSACSAWATALSNCT